MEVGAFCLFIINKQSFFITAQVDRCYGKIKSCLFNYFSILISILNKIDLIHVVCVKKKKIELTCILIVNF